MSIIPNIFLVFAALLLPVAACVFVSVRLRTAKPVLLGAACFFIFQVCTRLPLIQLVLPRLAGFTAFAALYPVSYMALISLSAGIFEEFGRYIVMRLFLRKDTACGIAPGIAFGVGHGACEAILLVGINALAMLLMNGALSPAATAADYIMAGVERILAMAAHIGFSVIVWCGVRRRAVWPVFAAVLLHGLFDFCAVYAAQAGLSVYAVEGIVAAFAALILLLAYFINKQLCIKEADTE